MTAKEFLELRRDELRDFFAGRFGYHWRNTVAHQTEVSARVFQKWYQLPPGSLFKLILRLEAYARSVGFESPADEPVRSAIEQREQLRQAAKAELARLQCERKATSSSA